MHIYGEQPYTINFYTQFESNLRPTTIHSVENKDLSALSGLKVNQGFSGQGFRTPAVLN